MATSASRRGAGLAILEHRLDNGLRVVLHEQRGSGVVAVHVCYHVGSAREVPGRTGFAHLFEHMLFQGSQHVAEAEHFRLVTEAGGTLNATTSRDRTLYYETLPASELELALWLESDRMGFLLPALTQANLDNQREVVKNERRQNYVNRPYGMSRTALFALLYPPEHPYHWLPIGSQEDLDAATLEDVQAFFLRWYAPNNAVLAIGGDFEPERALDLAARWFGEIPRGAPVDAPAPRPALLQATRRGAVEDAVQLPRLDLAWASVPRHHPDDAPLELAGMLLAHGRASVLERALTVDALLARSVAAAQDSHEVAGQLGVSVTAAPGVSLDELEGRVHELIADLARRGPAPEHLRRVQTRYEADFVRALETVTARNAAIAETATLRGDPHLATEELRRIRAVRPADVARVLQRHVVGRPFAAVSTVPHGRGELAAGGSAAAAVPAPAERAAPSPERSRRPDSLPPRPFRSPPLWNASLASGALLLGAPVKGPPLTLVQIAVPGGRVREEPGRAGIASLCAQLLTEGTRRLSTTQMAETLDALGASLRTHADDDELQIGLSVLDRNVPAGAEILADVLLEPRFDPADFERLKRRRLIDIERRSDSIQALAADAWARVVHGDAPEGRPSLGTRATIEPLALGELAEHWRRARDPRSSRLVLASHLKPAAAARAFAQLGARWEGGPARPEPPQPAFPERASGTRIHLVDKPGAAQSELRVGHLAVSSLHPDFDLLAVLNYVVGGSFSSRINLNLREDKGYTYGSRSSFAGGLRPGPFTVATAVQTEVTAPAVREIVLELARAREGLRQDELDYARRALRQGLLRQFESASSRLALADQIGKYGWPADILERRLARIDALTLADLDALARRHLRVDALEIVVAGDRARVAADLAALDLGEVIAFLEGEA